MYSVVLSFFHTQQTDHLGLKGDDKFYISEKHITQPFSEFRLYGLCEMVLKKERKKKNTLIKLNLTVCSLVEVFRGPFTITT